TPISPQRVRPGLHLMLNTLGHVPAFVLGRRADVLASNRPAREVLTGVARPESSSPYVRWLPCSPPPGRVRLRGAEALRHPPVTDTAPPAPTVPDPKVHHEAPVVPG
ncbi:MmyB family transcriptional regulator, partial [Streptomyces adelaidensis]|uniref:MmyB family transcriptional regulator n=1 Tax=Streptomyces adelaidensis TaxID=2796465 RepID=UPI003FD8B362